jgi:hypothetical protein
MNLNYQNIEGSGTDTHEIWEILDDPSGHDGMPVTIPGQPPIILQPSKTAKYLGVWLENTSTSRHTGRKFSRREQAALKRSMASQAHIGDRQ